MNWIIINNNAIDLRKVDSIEKDATLIRFHSTASGNKVLIAEVNLGDDDTSAFFFSEIMKRLGAVDI